ncbi:MAG: glycosyltransferase family 4 protein [Chitinispirillaceae bacterium]
MKLFILSDSYWPLRGGIEETVRLLAALLPSRFEVKLAVHLNRPVSQGLFHRYASCKSQNQYRDPSGKPVSVLNTSFLEYLILLPLLLWQFPFLRRIGPARFYDTLYFPYRLVFKRRIADFLKEADVVHCYSTGYLARCAQQVCAELGKPLVQTPAIHFGRWGDSPGQMEAYGRSDAVVCFTRSFRREFLSRLNGLQPRTEIIAPIVQQPQRVHLPRPLIGERFVLFIGRREAHKGLCELVEAFKHLPGSAVLAVAGPGPAVNGTENVVDLGVVDEKEKKWLLEHCECLCVPSRDETFGIVYAEAMSYGRPVVALDVAPVNEIVRDGVEGILLSGADPEKLCRALKTMLDDEGKRRSMGEAARERFERNYSPVRTVGAVESLYEGVAAGKPRG